MTVLSLHPDSIQEHLPNSRWLVACLCAAWCDTCNAYRSAFEALAEKHPDKCFCWIDIEDQASLVEDIDIENFPTILVQVDDQIEFLGTMLPDTQQLHRMMQSFNAPEDGSRKQFQRTSLNQHAPNNWNLRNSLLAIS